MEMNSQIQCGDAISVAQIQPGEIVLKIGVNMYGLVKLSHLVEKKGIVIGVDNSREVLYRAKGLLMMEKVTNVSLIECEINQLPIKDNTIDVIICNSLHNHIWDKKIIFNQFYRVLKKGGRAIINDIIAPRPNSPDIENYRENPSKFCARAVSKEDYCAIIKSSGLVVSMKFEDSCYLNDGYLMGCIIYNLSKI